MAGRKTALVEWCQSARTLKSLHGWLTLFWIGMAFPTVLLWSKSIQYLVFISVYAVITGHWGSWQASRVEVKQVEAEEVAS